MYGASTNRDGTAAVTQRQRLGVAVMIPDPAATEIDGLRRALGDTALARIAPHITLAAPVNVHHQRFEDARDVVRAAAATTLPFRLELGPMASFGPGSETAFLDVAGDGLPRLEALHRALRRAPLLREPTQRSDDRAFRAHVTVLTKQDPAQVAAVVGFGKHYRVTVAVDSVHLLELLTPQSGVPRWAAIDEFAFGLPVVVGRGGFETEITVARYAGILDIRARHDARDVGRAVVGIAGTAPQALGDAGTAVPPGDQSSRVGFLVSLDVNADLRGCGIGTRLLTAVEFEARRADLLRLHARSHPFLETRGWTNRDGNAHETVVRDL
jgi:2'-5' RNA ligase